MTIKAIKTFYKNYHFRSRLEARWAVFFDALGLDWGYEVEGFTLGSDDYLPDFLIKGSSHYPDIWVEIKPDKVMEKSDTLRYYKIGTEFSESKSNIGFFNRTGRSVSCQINLVWFIQRREKSMRLVRQWFRRIVYIVIRWAA